MLLWCKSRPEAGHWRGESRKQKKTRRSERGGPFGKSSCATTEAWLGEKM